MQNYEFCSSNKNGWYLKAILDRPDRSNDAKNKQWTVFTKRCDELKSRFLPIKQNVKIRIAGGELLAVSIRLCSKNSHLNQNQTFAWNHRLRMKHVKK